MILGMQHKQSPIALETGSSATRHARVLDVSVAGPSSDTISGIQRTLIEKLLSDRNIRLDTVLSRRGANVVVGASNKTSGEHQLLVLRVGHEVAVIAADPLPLAEIDNYPELSWRTLAPGGNLALMQTWLYDGEWPPRSRVLVDSSSRFVLMYSGDLSTCRAAEWEDADGDGFSEIIAYREPLTDDCGHPCLRIVRDTAGVEPAWLEVLRWDGHAWVRSQDRFLRYYETLAKSYARAATMLSQFRPQLCESLQPELVMKLREWQTRALKASR